jgi:hypothetical protein
MKLEEQFPEAERFHELLEKEARYDALLAVLRQCVEAIKMARSNLMSWNAMRFVESDGAERITKLYEQSPDIKSLDAAFAAAKAKLEESK